MYELHLPTRDLRFTMYYRTRDGISSTLEEQLGKE
jgi:hypothetical protein